MNRRGALQSMLRDYVGHKGPRYLLSYKERTPHDERTLAALAAGYPEAAARQVQCTRRVSGQARGEGQNHRGDKGERHAHP